MKVSECCGTLLTGMWEDVLICPSCREHCEGVDEDDESETMGRIRTDELIEESYPPSYAEGDE